MRKYQSIKDFCKESGLSEYAVRRACNSAYGKEICQPISQAANSKRIINTQKFLELWDKGYLGRVS